MTVYYECQRCTACCRWPGQVKVSEQEITAMAQFLAMTVEEFTERFTRLRPDRQGLLLQERDNHECIFLDGKDCRVQPVKPQQCRDFPNNWNFPGWEKLCWATPREVPLESDDGKA